MGIGCLFEKSTSQASKFFQPKGIEKDVTDPRFKGIMIFFQWN